jgi:hypothetical protein
MLVDSGEPSSGVRSPLSRLCGHTALELEGGYDWKEFLTEHTAVAIVGNERDNHRTS